MITDSGFVCGIFYANETGFLFPSLVKIIIQQAYNQTLTDNSSFISFTGIFIFPD